MCANANPEQNHEDPMNAHSDDHEAARLLAGPIAQRVHDLGHLPVPRETRREALREIDQVVHEEMDDDDTDSE